MSEASDFMRMDAKRNDDIRDAGLTTPADIVRLDDIPYGPDPACQSLDLYRPRSAGGQKLPVLFSVHGGGWVYGDKERYQYYCMSLAQRGFAVVNFTYRLAPEHKYPAPLEDTNLVVRWILDHGEELALDTDHVFAVGDSAGAHLLSLYACICTNPAYAAEYDFAPPAGFAPTALALNCGNYDISLEPGSPKTRPFTQQLLADFLPEGGHMTPAFPPSFLMTANGDFLKAQVPILSARLAELEVPHIARFYGTPARPLNHVFHCDMRLEEARLCNDEECDFFRRFLPAASGKE